MPLILDGKTTAAGIKADLALKVAEFKKETGVTPSLTVIIVGEDPASKIYVKNKKNACIAVGMDSTVIELPEDTGEDELLSLIDALNRNNDVHGILVQLPLPAHINEEKIIDAILPEKDVDGFHPINAGRLTIGKPGFLPCTPRGIIALLDRYGIDLQGKDAVVIGRSNIVGKPAALMLLSRNATVTVCHKKTKNTAEKCANADIIVLAVGKPRFLTADMVKPGAVVIDVGINRSEDGKICGDADFDAVAPLCSAITPVPGGIGPMTIAMLLCNTLEAAQKQILNK